MRRTRIARRALAGGLLGVGLLLAGVPVAEPSNAHDGHASPRPVDSPGGRALQSVHPQWWKSGDFAVTGHGDSAGYRLSIAWEKELYHPRPLAAIQPGGYDADDWLGYQCVTGDLRYAVVTLLPARAVNNAQARDRGALVYSVRISDGQVRPLAGGVAMKQHAVNCGTGSQVAALRHLDTDQRRSELILIDAATGKVDTSGAVDGQLIWPVPLSGTVVVAAKRSSIVRWDTGSGRVRQVTSVDGNPTTLTSSRHGVEFLTHRGGAEAVAWRLHGDKAVRLGSGPVDSMRLVRVPAGDNALFGLDAPGAGTPAGVRKGAKLGADAGGRLPAVSFASVRGEMYFAAPEKSANGWRMYAASDGKRIGGAVATPPAAASPVTELPRPLATLTANTTNPTCSVPRNDPRRQAYGPDSAQVRWAVEMASKNRLTGANARPANYLQSGLPAYSPSNDFSIPALLPTGGNVPPAVMNGILAQENNYRHASRRSLPGSGGNPAIGDYYGNGSTTEFIDYDNADCGYGIAQVTTGMRLTDTSITPNGKAKIAIDYAENIQAGMQILAKKWNQLYSAGIRMNSSDPSIVENWYFAIWAYNTGVQPDANNGNTTGCTPSPSCTDGSGRWGLGWANNPMNPDYPHPRTMFLSLTYADAEHPSDWPYQERVFGWMQTPIHTYLGSDAYPPVQDMDPSDPVDNRLSVPDRTAFCSLSANNCDPVTDAGCQLANYHCWWHEPATWPVDCAATCHRSSWTYSDTAAEPSAANPWAPACNSDLGSSAVIIDELPNPAYNLFCPSRNWSNGGSFSYTTGGLGQIDFHQLATGFGAHTWFAGNRVGTDAEHRVTGTWTPNGLTTGVYTVKVHIPKAGASAGSAVYKVTLADGTVRELVVNQHEHYNHWKSLGVFQLGSNAKVVLDNVTRDDTEGGRSTVAFDAVAFVPTSGEYVQRRIDAVAYFDEDIELFTNFPTSITTGPFGSAQAAYDWAMDLTGNAVSLPHCTGIPTSGCVPIHLRSALEAWRTNVIEAGTGHGLNHPTGKSVMQWMALANDYQFRPFSPTKPTWFDGTDDAIYKLKSSATVSYVIGTDGKIVPGSADVAYDDRTADTHLPSFVRQIFSTVEQDYGIAQPDLSYAVDNLNEYDHQSGWANPNADGVLPGRAFKHGALQPQVLNAAGDVVTSGGECVTAGQIAGGMIGYRPMIDTGYVPAAVLAWREQLNQTAVVPQAIKDLAREVYGMFFMPGGVTVTWTGAVPPVPIVAPVGSPMAAATPIWQELSFKACVDGTIQRWPNPNPGGSAQPVLQASWMPNQYLYIDGESMGLDGNRTYTSLPVINGNFRNFTNIQDYQIGSYAWPNQFGSCRPEEGQNGNPWDLMIWDIGDVNPDRAHLCSDTSQAFDPEYN